MPITIRRAALGAALALSLASCVSEGKFRELEETAEFYERGYHDYERYVPGLEAENERLRAELALMAEPAAVPAGFHDDVDQRLAELDELLQRVGAPAGDLTAFPIEGGVGYALSDGILFDLASTEVTAEGRALLEQLATVIAERDVARVWVRGHTDDVPIVKPETRARFPYGNLQLSSERAVVVASVLVETGLVDASIVAVAGLGPHEPLVPNSTADARARNRRVELHVLDRVAEGESP